LRFDQKNVSIRCSDIEREGIPRA